jgi:hypothetical protein
MQKNVARLIHFFTGYCALCRATGWVHKSGHWGVQSKACPVCRGPAEGSRIGKVALA